MARLAPLWQQNNSYPASTDRVLLGTLWPTSGSTGGAVQVVNNTMQVQILAGTAAVSLGSSGVNYTALCRWDAAEVVTLQAAPPAGNSRIDVIVLQVRDAALDAGSNNDFIFQAIAGTATTGTPAAPAVPANAYAVAQLTVPGGAANLNGVTVVDRRLPLLPRDALHARVYRNAAWNATPTTTPIAYDTVDRDPAGLYSVANQRFTAPVAGWYLVVVRWAGSTTVGQGVDQAVLVNGVLYVSATSLVASATQWLKSSGTAVVRCAAGDYVQPAIGATTTVTMATGAVDSACTFSYLGTG